MQERPSASTSLIAWGIVSGYSPPCSSVSKRRPVPSIFGSCGRFSGVSWANRWVSFMPCRALACDVPVRLFAIGIEDADGMTVDRLQGRDARELDGAAMFGRVGQKLGGRQDRRRAALSCRDGLDEVRY